MRAAAGRRAWAWAWAVASLYLLGAARAFTAPGGAVFFQLEGNSCATPEGRAGVCRLIRDCPSMLALLSGRPSQESLYILNLVRCGYEGNQPVVCCSDGPTQTTKPTTTRRPVTARPPKPRPVTTTTTTTTTSTRRPPPARPAVEEMGSSPPDVQRHPNLRLLPELYCSPGGTDRIVGGKVADVYAYPWIARLGYRSKTATWRPVTYRCGGSLISERYVLTAAHCIITKTDLHLATVKLGEHTIDKEVDCRTNNGGCIPRPIDVDVEKTVVHPGYDPGQEGNHHDVALARLARRVDFQAEEFVRPVCLPTSRENQLLRLDASPLVVAGWGLTEYGEGSNALKDVLVPVVPLDRCKEVYKRSGLAREIIPQQLCAGGETGKDSCNGDSGGPLMLEANVGDEPKTVQFGIVSFGHSTCGTAGVPGVYTRVAFYMKWILDTMKP